MAFPCIYDVLRSAKSLRFLFSLLPQMIITRVSGQLSRPWPTSPQSVTQLQHCTARRSKQRGQSHSVQKYRSAFVSVEAALNLVAGKPKCKQNEPLRDFCFANVYVSWKKKLNIKTRKNEKIPFFETMRFFSRSWWGSMLRNFLPGWRKLNL